jgi:protein-S-isoprenylcysteine O-methyltransferase Ste14
VFHLYFFGDTYFPGLLFKNIFQILFCIILITETAILFFTVWNNRGKSGERTKQDRGSMLLMIVGYWAAVFLNPICIRLAPFVFPLSLFWAGAALVLLGIFLRVYSVWTLKKSFTLNVQVGSTQNIIRSGPYGQIRHPAYTGSILTLLGVAFSFRSPLGMLATAIIITVIYGYRVKVEEKLLEESFGEAYRSYEKETWRFVPHIW